ncbi:MAG: (2Fe-2S)-binding protein, partial [Acidimicrobiia bacterium]
GIVHAGLNGAASVAYVGSYVARRRGRHGRGVALGLVGATFATAAGHLGGHLLMRLGIGTGDPGRAGST